DGTAESAAGEPARDVPTEGLVARGEQVADTHRRGDLLERQPTAQPVPGYLDRVGVILTLAAAAGPTAVGGVVLDGDVGEAGVGQVGEESAAVAETADGGATTAQRLVARKGDVVHR